MLNHITPRIQPWDKQKIVYFLKKGEIGNCNLPFAFKKNALYIARRINLFKTDARVELCPIKLK